MRQITIYILSLILLSGCDKNASEPDTILVDLSIISTNTPAVLLQGQDIISNVKCSGPDLCYHFSRFDIQETTTRHFEIRAKSTYPNGRKGDIVCLQAIYYKDTTVKISAVTKGPYILRFFNNNLLFKSDTVQVN